VFGPEVEFGHEFNGIVCNAADLEAPNPGADPVMARYTPQLLGRTTKPHRRLLAPAVGDRGAARPLGGECARTLAPAATRRGGEQPMATWNRTQPTVVSPGTASMSAARLCWRLLTRALARTDRSGSVSAWIDGARAAYPHGVEFRPQVLGRVPATRNSRGGRRPGPGSRPERRSIDTARAVRAPALTGDGAGV